VIVLGVVLILIGWLIGLGLLETLGIILLVVGLLLLLLGSTGHYAGRRWY